nr:triatox [Triatoma infestans]ABR27914.1 triatox [Triatoma infestans]
MRAMTTLRVLLAVCCAAYCILAEDVTVPANGELKLMPDQKAGGRLEGQWKISTPDHYYLIVSCGLWSSASGTCKDKILITQGGKTTEVCGEGKNSFYVQQDTNLNTAEIIILTNTPDARAMCTVYSAEKPKEENTF